MKKLFSIFIVPALILLAGTAWATTFTTPMIDGMIGPPEWDPDEQFATMTFDDADYTLWITWDYEAIYIGIDRMEPNGKPIPGNRFLGDGPEDLSLFVAIDTDPPVVPNPGTTLDGYQTVTFSGGHLPDYYYAFAGGGGWYEWAQWDVLNNDWIWMGWRDDGTFYGWPGGPVDDELTILWDDIGRPEGIAVRVWITGEISDPDPWPPAVLAAWPEENPVGVFPDLPWSYEFYAGHYHDALGPSFMPQPAMEIIPNITDHSVPVTLSSFSATGRAGAIEISWTSQTEVNALAYHLLRSEAADGQFEEITRIDAHGNSETALDYRYVDSDVVAGQTYYYQLADEDYEGNMKYHGMVFASAGTSVPGAYSLLPNYPNPFNPSTVIGYEIPEAGQVTVTIYNVLGQEIRTLVDKQHQAGTYNVMWDSKDSDGQYLRSGVYFYTLRAGDFTDTRKMVLMR